MLKVLIAPDSFKESLSAIEVAQAIELGIQAACARYNTPLQPRLIPMADGGEGTVDCLLHSTPSQAIHSTTVNALGQTMQAQWAWLDEQKTAFIEMASAAGLQQIPVEQRDILQSSTYGVGILIKEALNYPIQRLVLGLGGSATNDAGVGMLCALGLQFLDAQGQFMPHPKLAQFQQIHFIDSSQLDPRLKEIDIILAADVRNPLCGPEGASAIFGPQKGASPEQVKQLEQALAHVAQIVEQHLSMDCANQPGAGAAGGLGFAALSFLSAKFHSGLQILAEYTGLADAIAQADLVISGEGSLDGQTLQGKTVAGIAQLCQEHAKPLVALVGRLQPGYKALYAQGLSAAFSINPGGISQEKAMQESAQLLSEAANNMMALFLVARNKHNQRN